MNKPITITDTVSGPLAFVADKGVSEDELAGVVDAVNRQIESVTRGLLEQLKAQGISAQLEKQGNEYLIVQEGVTPARAAQDAALSEPGGRRSRIRIVVRSSDAPPTINATRRFFRDWRAVAGLVVVGGAWQFGQWLMGVRREE